MRDNPFIAEYNTIHNTTPFKLIETEDYEPAILEGIRKQNEAILQITDNIEKPSFDNTIVALERSGELLDRVITVFSNLLSAETNDKLQELAERLMPMVSEHSNNILLNEKLYARIKEVYNSDESSNLNYEQTMLLNKTYDSFVRHGANLSNSEKDIYRSLTSKLTTLTLKFSQNILKETNNFQLVIDNDDDLQGLPEYSIRAAKELAEKKGKTDSWIFTLHAPSMVPFLKYCNKRELRETIYKSYNTICTHDNEYNNLTIVKDIVNTRFEIAKVLGYESFADYVLKNRMAKSCEDVYKLLDELYDAYMPVAKKEVKEVEDLAKSLEGDDFVLMPWDWSFYSEKLKKNRFDINEEVLRPYFELSKVIDGVFGLASTLYGIQFRENNYIQVYNEDVKAYEVFDNDGKLLSVLYTDFHPRDGKRSGAWMTNYKEQWKDKSGDSRPHVSITMNFTKPIGDSPALLSHSEVNTFLHEFGHALHGIFADSTYQSLSGTNVYWDFVELPSQIMENYANEKDFLNTFANHYKTGEQIPSEIIQNLIDASNFNAGYLCIRQLSLGYLDMAWYGRRSKFEGDVMVYEKEVFEKTKLLPSVDGCCMSAQFSHIMSGGYSAGYYSYKWAEVLEADAFSVFKKNGIFNEAVAASFRENILSKGGTKDPIELYKSFKGSAPTIDALLRRNNIIN